MVCQYSKIHINNTQLYMLLRLCIKYIRQNFCGQLHRKTYKRICSRKWLALKNFLHLIAKRLKKRWYFLQCVPKEQANISTSIAYKTLDIISTNLPYLLVRRGHKVDVQYEEIIGIILKRDSNYITLYITTIKMI